jgi:azurin
LCDTFADAAAATAAAEAANAAAEAATAAAAAAATAANSDNANSNTAAINAKATATHAKATATNAKATKKKKKVSGPSWRLKNFTHGPDSYFGAGKLSLSIGNFAVGHQVRIPTICDTKPRLSLKIAFGR